MPQSENDWMERGGGKDWERENILMENGRKGYRERGEKGRSIEKEAENVALYKQRNI